MTRYNGVEIEDTFAETLSRVEISPAKPPFFSLGKRPVFGYQSFALLNKRALITTIIELVAI
ncbi:MAG: hypothetical protein NWE80_00765, partial [Candidatus Bathyarchaeota archaeon]|nr:hypothetical protein [Candidatus Bathyarchaeota archaeon]